jgi:prepilin-type N-terminal cleavage/methylation domain-containing protein
MAWRCRRSAAHGVTLLEMMVVLGLLAVLAAIVIPVFGGIQSRQRRATCAANLRAISEALLLYRDDYRAFPPDVTEDWGGKKALGLFYLNYLVPNAVPTTGVVYSTAQGDYLRDEKFLHCPANPVEKPDYSGLLSGSADAAYLGGYNAYDWYYRRDWDDYLKSLGGAFAGGWPEMGNRKLKQAYPPANTVVTWCTMHRNARPTSTLEGLQWDPERGDQDIVLFVDGTVEVLPASKEQYKAQHP